MCDSDNDEDSVTVRDIDRLEECVPDNDKDSDKDVENWRLAEQDVVTAGVTVDDSEADAV